MSGNVIKVYVHTGDVKGAGTDANVTIVIHDAKGNKTSPIKLDNFFRNDFERGQLDVFRLGSRDTSMLTDKPHVLELSRDNSGFGSEWYLDSVTIATHDGTEFPFPFNRWVHAHTSYRIPHLDTLLPQHDPFPEERARRLLNARDVYKVADDKEGPARIQSVPAEEDYSDAYKSFLQGVRLKATFENFTNILKPRTWSRLSQLEELFSDITGLYQRPGCVDYWREDWWFGSQRLAGVDPTIISLCRQIPAKMAVTEQELLPFLEGLSLAQVVEQNRLFVCDLFRMKDFRNGHKGRVLTSPIALFYVNNKEQLMPIAIQLFQDPGADNPVFFPSDDPYTWLLAKMWYNVGESNHHQSLTHLNLTHILMESFCLATHRELSGNHPIFRLLKVHFMFLFNINSRANNILLAPDGLFDAISAIGSTKLRELGRRRLLDWRVDVDGTLPECLKARGVDDPNILPNYYYRHDAMLLYNAIKKYVRSYVCLYYHDDQELQADTEIQAWAAALAASRDQGGYGIQGMPLTQGKLTSRDDLVLVLACIIFTCSVQHAAVNFPQYDHFSYAPNYPFLLLGDPPTDKVARSEEDVVKLIPDKDSLLDGTRAVSIFSSRGTTSLGTPLGSFIVDPPAVTVGQQFRQDLKDIEKVILEQNKSRVPGYDYLNPALVPNSISI
nr:hypothetical protein BaRGS_003394 [Batillaria attramentaria]